MTLASYLRARRAAAETPETPLQPLGYHANPLINKAETPETPETPVFAATQGEAANEAEFPDLAQGTDPDRCCWPHSVAWNAKEIDAFTARLARFTDKGVSHDEAERLADALVSRDREGDDRRLCLECTHLQGAGRWRCGNWKAADVAREALARDLVLRLQRCSGFAALGPHQASEGPKP